MKILYGIGNRLGAEIQAHRIANTLADTFYFIGYHIHQPFQFHWNATSLLQFADISNNTKINTINNFNLDILFSQIEKLEIDLIISDSEPFSGIISKKLNIPLWVVSPIIEGLNYNFSKIIYKNYHQLFKKNKQESSFYLDHASKRLIYSYWGDAGLVNKTGYQFIRPYSYWDKKEHSEDRQITKLIKSLDLSLYDPSTYVNHIQNSKYIWINGCLEESVNDCYYNGKMINYIPNYQNLHSIVNGYILDLLGIGKIHTTTDIKQQIISKSFTPTLDKSIKYLHQLF